MLIDAVKDFKILNIKNDLTKNEILEIYSNKGKIEFAYIKFSNISFDISFIYSDNIELLNKKFIENIEIKKNILEEDEMTIIKNFLILHLKNNKDFEISLEYKLKTDDIKKEKLDLDAFGFFYNFESLVELF